MWERTAKPNTYVYSGLTGSFRITGVPDAVFDAPTSMTIYDGSGQVVTVMNSGDVEAIEGGWSGTLPKLFDPARESALAHDETISDLLDELGEIKPD